MGDPNYNSYECYPEHPGLTWGEVRSVPCMECDAPPYQACYLLLSDLRSNINPITVEGCHHEMRIAAAAHHYKDAWARKCVVQGKPS